MRAINRTLEHTKTITKREVSGVYAVTKTNVADTLKGDKATRSKLTAKLHSKGARINLSKFRITPKQYSKTAKVVKVKVKKGEGMKPITTDPKAFVQTIYGNEPEVYRRKDKRKLPVMTLKTLAIPQMIEQEKVEDKIQRQMTDTFNKRLVHELNRELEKAAKKK